MSAKLFQTMILQFKNELSRDVAVLDSGCVVIASTDLRKIGNMDYQAVEFLDKPNENYYDNIYKKVFDDAGNLKNIVLVSGRDEKARELCAILTTSVSSLNTLYDNKYDKTTFIKNVLLDNILPGDIYIKSNELDLDEKSYKVVFLIRQTNLTETKILDCVSKHLETENHFVIHINQRDLAVVYNLKKELEETAVNKIAQDLKKAVEKNGITDVLIGYGSVYATLENISKSYKEAQIALEVSEVFDTEKTIIGYQNLGIGRLIYQLPTTLCRMFLGEVFKKGSIENLDEETLSTIKAFFENNLNVSETSRRLFVHRNTLVYRLEKIKKITGLDLREFDHAIVFKVALMVRKYLEARDDEKILF